MYTVKITGSGVMTYRNSTTRLPATFRKVPKKDLKYFETVCRSRNNKMEILEKESERLSSVIEKLHDPENENLDLDSEIDGTETKIEDLFDSEDALGSLINNIEKE